MSNFDFYKNNFPNHFSLKSDVSIMLTFVFLEKRVVSIRFSTIFALKPSEIFSVQYVY